MKKLRKGKKILLLILIAIIVIIAAIFIVKTVVNKEPETPETPVDEIQEVLPLPETTYVGMEVKDIYMEYLKSNNETMVTMTFINTTQKDVVEGNLNAILINGDGNVIGTMPSPISAMKAGEEISMSVIWDGDLTATKEIKLEKKQ